MEIYTTNGHTFLIDTSDWSCEESAEVAADTIKDLLDACESYDGYAMERISRAAFNEATKDWQTIPNRGHNCHVQLDD